MNVLIDTSIWSKVLRKSKTIKQTDPVRKIVTELIEEFRVSMIGPIRQEILFGISNQNQFLKLREILRSFEDYPLNSFDYERAAEMFNICRKKGVQGSHIDFVICAAAERYNLSIFTLDGDFHHYAKHLPIRLFNNGATAYLAPSK